MRTVEKGYGDYGLSPDEAIKTLNYCRNWNAEKETNIRAAITCSNRDLEEQLYKSMVHGLSYEKLSKKEYIPIGEKDFYGYRRKAIYNLYCMIMLFGELRAE